MSEPGPLYLGKSMDHWIGLQRSYDQLVEYNKRLIDRNKYLEKTSVIACKDKDIKRQGEVILELQSKIDKIASILEGENYYE